LHLLEVSALLVQRPVQVRPQTRQAMCRGGWTILDASAFASRRRTVT
jgi:hypothetical protein